MCPQNFLWAFWVIQWKETLQEYGELDTRHCSTQLRTVPWRDLALKKMYKWPGSTRDDAQHRYHQGNENQSHKERPPNPSRMVLFFFLKTQKIVSVGEDVQIWNLYVLLWEYKMMQSLWKAVRQVLKNWKTELPHDWAIPFLGIHPKQLKAGIWIETYKPMFFQ